MLGTPAARVGRIHPDHGDPATAGHTDQPGTETRGGDAGYRAAQSLSALSAAEGFPAGDARVGEVEVLHHHRRAVLLLGVIEQIGDGRAHPPIAVRRRQPGGNHLDAYRLTDRVARAVEHAGGQMVGVEVHTQHPPSSQFIELGHRFGKVFQDASRYQRPRAGS